MPARENRLEALVLTRRLSGENLWRFELLSPGDGLHCAFSRNSSKSKISLSAIQLFDRGDFCLVSSGPSTNAPWFVKEFRLLHRPIRLGSSYPALAAASSLALLWTANLSQAEPSPISYRIFISALEALEDQLLPQAVILKAIYRLARAEGLPAHEDWESSLHGAQALAASDLLHKPLAQSRPEALAASDLLHSLINWLSHQPGWVIPPSCS